MKDMITCSSKLNAMAIRKFAVVALAVLLILQSAPAQAQTEIRQYSADYDVSIPAVNADIAFIFDRLDEQPFEMQLEGAKNMVARDSRGPLDYTLEESGGVQTVRISHRNDSSLFVSFETDSMVFSSGDVHQFYSEFAAAIKVANLHIDVKLPEGFVAESIFPRGAVTRSDGRRIIVTWDLPNPVSTPFSIRFESTAKSDMLPFFALIVLIIVIVVLFVHFRRKSQREFIHGFFDDERKVIQYMMKHKVAWQNKVEKEYGFSRAKTTRIVKKLEARGLLTKERRGRTNRLTWVKGRRLSKEDQKKLERKLKLEEKTRRQEELERKKAAKKQREEEIKRQLLGQ